MAKASYVIEPITQAEHDDIRGRLRSRRNAAGSFNVTKKVDEATGAVSYLKDWQPGFDMPFGGIEGTLDGQNVVLLSDGSSAGFYRLRYLRPPPIGISI
ncbi:hypothetical protein [Ancylobacter novellus]|uniref:hypothetical protein n=1 Tax=Ancylobacter novellus TaxID=921 RepID=UPI0005A2E3E3|nr:hypothetical protein [Ancylobacter novellus]